MREHLTFVLCASISCLGLIHCVGDDPGTAGNDAGTDSSTSGDSSITDGGNAGDSSTTGDGSTKADSGVDAGFVDSCIGHVDCPDHIESTSLQLWLRGNIGENCTADHRLTLWTDQSPGHRNATPGITEEGDAGLPPQCGVGSIGTTPTVTFTAPGEPDAGKATEFIDETMAVSLGVLNSTDYTVIVVHQRATDSASGLLATDNSFIPSGGHGPVMCHSASTDPEAAFSLGFDELVGTQTGLTYSEGCANGGDPNDTFLANTPEADELTFSQTAGHRLLINGVAVYTGDTTGNDLSPEEAVGAGIIGRGTNAYGGDSRYTGNIGEIIIYSQVLTPSDFTAIHAHLTRQWGINF